MREKLPEPRRLPIFVSPDGRRPRYLRLVGRVVASLTALWLVALFAGTVGVGGFPGMPPPNARVTAKASARPTGRPDDTPSAPTTARATRARPSPSATDHSPRWTDTGG